MRTKTQAKGTDGTLDSLDDNLQHSQDLARLQALLTRGRVEEARSFVKELEARWPESDLVRGFARVLAPPVARVTKGREGMTREQSRTESAWLREHAREYPGCWVILLEDRLIAAHPELRAAVEEADRHLGRELGSLYFVPRDVSEE